MVKRLMDYGFHPPTIYFPLVVHGAIMIEPTETDRKRISIFSLKHSERSPKRPMRIRRAFFRAPSSESDKVG